MPSILLNMIVKNEAHVIVQTLTNLYEKIKFNYYVISDTGSTDNTKELIKNFFDSKSVKGEIYDDEWKDFGHNRTKALEHAYDKSDFLFVFDADDGLFGDFRIPNKVEFDSYHLKFGNGYSLNYWRVCLVNNRKKWKYVGVLHEYITLVEGQGPQRNAHIEGNYYVSHGTTGGRSADPLKYHKDAAILDKAFNELPESDPLRNRYSFYCANSYKDAGNVDKAIEWYIKTINLPNGWPQEKYRCCIQLFNLFTSKQEVEKALFYAAKSIKFDRNRVEGILRLVQHYCCDGMDDIAWKFYTVVQDWYENVYYKGSSLEDKLFIDILDYDFMLPYFVIIIADRVKQHATGVKMYDMIFTKQKVAGQWFIDNLLHNFQFYVKHVNKTNVAFMEKMKNYISLLESNNLKVKESFYFNMYQLLTS